MSLNSIKNIFHDFPKLKRLQQKSSDLHLIATFNEIKDQYFPPHIARDIQAVEIKYKTLVVACLNQPATQRVRDAEQALLQIVKQTHVTSRLEKIVCIW